VAADDAEISAGGHYPRYETTARGAELGIANVLFLRSGHYRDLTGDIDGITWGWGLNLPFGKLAGIRYDGALTPQAEGLEDVERHGVTVWFNPLEMHDSRSHRRHHHRAIERD